MKINCILDGVLGISLISEDNVYSRQKFIGGVRELTVVMFSQVKGQLHLEVEFSKNTSDGGPIAGVIRAKKYTEKGWDCTTDYNAQAMNLEWFLNEMLFYSIAYGVYTDDLLHQLSNLLGVTVGLKWIDENWYSVNAAREELVKIMSASHQEISRSCWKAYFSRGEL